VCDRPTSHDVVDDAGEVRSSNSRAMGGLSEDAGATRRKDLDLIFARSPVQTTPVMKRLPRDPVLCPKLWADHAGDGHDHSHGYARSTSVSVPRMAVGAKSSDDLGGSISAP
jgi:hypothetical protein